MRKQYLATGIFLLCVIALRWDGRAQQNIAASVAPYESDILSARPVRYFLGFAFGGYAHQHLGSFSPSCECEFKDQSGSRILLGADLSIHYPKLGFGFKSFFTIHNYSADFSFKSTRLAVYQNEPEPQEAEFESTSNVQLQYLTITPSFVTYYPGSTLFAFGGIEISIPLKYKYNNIERVLTPGAMYYDTSYANTLLREVDIPGGNRIRFGISAGLGADIYLTDSFYLTPILGGNLPLTPVSSSDESWKVISGYALLILKFRLK